MSEVQSAHPMSVVEDFADWVRLATTQPHVFLRYSAVRSKTSRTGRAAIRRGSVSCAGAQAHRLDTVEKPSGALQPPQLSRGIGARVDAAHAVSAPQNLSGDL